MCHLRALQLSGYFGAVRARVCPSLDREELLVAGLLLRLFLSMQYNTHAITTSTDRTAMAPSQTKPFHNTTKWVKSQWIHLTFTPCLMNNYCRIIGSAIYPTFALFNHSCANNTYKFFCGSQLVVVASKDIQPGEEVTENYFPSVQLIARPERRSWLADHYRYVTCLQESSKVKYFRFDCKCTGCVDNQPTLQSAPSGSAK